MVYQPQPRRTNTENFLIQSIAESRICEKEDFYIIELGLKYNQLIKFYEEIKQKYKIIGFSDMTIEEIAKDANLNLDQAEMAKKRDFDLPFKILNKSEKKDIFREIKQKGLNYTIGGRYYHLIADNDKGRAVKVLSNLFKREFNEIYSIGIGDSENDFPMLDEVESPYLVQRKNGTYASDKYYLSDGIGPIGWTKVIESELK